jgi:hypothetical protein
MSTMNALHPILTIAALLVLTGCGNKPQSTATSPAAAPPAVPEAAAPSAKPVAAPAAAESPAAAAESTATATAAAEDPQALAKRKKIAFALSEQAMADDPKGQWAATATASSTYGKAKDKAGFSAWQATGAPNVSQRRDDPNSWTPAEANAGIEWLEVTFARPVHATEIRVRQNFNPGAIIKVELIDDKGVKQTVFEGADERKYDEWTWWFTQGFPKTANLVTGAKITLATNAVAGWNQIDAVQLIGE